MSSDPRQPLTEPFQIRAGRDSDGEGMARLIAACFAEYPGCLFELAEFPELGAPATHFAGKGGRLWVAAGAQGDILGSIAATPLAGAAVVEITKMYVASPWRGSGLAQALYGRARAFAASSGAGEIMLWSDVLFTRAHAFYARLGFERQAHTRRLADVSNTEEYQFRLIADLQGSRP